MAQVTAALVKQLREMTDSPMMECKKALVEAEGDLEKAVDILRTIGVAKAVKRAGRDTNEGTIATYVSEDGKTAAILELTCETDFVGTNPKFTGFAADLAKVVAEANPGDVEALKTCDLNGESVEAALTEMIHNIGENMKINRFERFETSDGALESYIHLGGKLAVVCEFAFANSDTFAQESFKTFAHDVCMHIAATAPVATTREEVPQETVDHELSIYKAQAAESGKPEAIQERMAQGRLDKYFKEFVLTEQEFVKDSSLTVKQLAEKVSKELGDTVEIKKFVRYVFGETE